MRKRSASRWAIALFVFSHMIATLYWNFPSDLEGTGADSHFARWTRSNFKSFMHIRQELQSTVLGWYCRRYIRIFALEQRWWLVSPNPTHYHQELEARISQFGENEEKVWLRDFTPMLGGTGANLISPTLREIVSIKKIIRPDLRFLAEDYAEYARAGFGLVYPGRKVSMVRVILKTEHFKPFPNERVIPVHLYPTSQVEVSEQPYESRAFVESEEIMRLQSKVRSDDVQAADAVSRAIRGGR